VIHEYRFYAIAFIAIHNSVAEQRWSKVVFIAGYLIASNDMNKQQQLAKKVEPFVESSEPILGPDTVTNMMNDVYKKVHGTAIPEAVLQNYKNDFKMYDFNAYAFQKKIDDEYKMKQMTLVQNVFAKVLHRDPTKAEYDKYANMYINKQITSPEQLEELLSSQ
jgi:hypothetical protein